MKDTICVAVGLAGGFFTAIFGGWLRLLRMANTL